MKSGWEMTQEVKKLPKLNNPIFIEGLPGIANVGKIAVDFMIDELKAQKLFSFFSYKFPHSVFVNEENLVDVPKLEIYYKKFNGNSKKRDILLLTGDIQPIDEESCYTFCDEIITLMKKFKCSEMITTGGIGLQHLPEKPKVYCTGNSQSLLKEYSKKGSKVSREIFGVVGPIVGVSGVLLGLGKRRKMKGIALLAETFGHPMYLGIKGAKELIRVVEEKFSYGLSMKRLSKEIIEVEKEIMQKTKEWASERAKHTQAGAQARNKEVSYIG